MAKNQNWAKDFAKAVNHRIETHAEHTFPRTEVAEIIKLHPLILIKPRGSTVVYDQDEVVWGLDRKALKKGDTVLLSRDTTDTPIITTRLDGRDPDPTFHPKGKALAQQVAGIHQSSRFWKAPVATHDALMEVTTDAHGAVRLVLGNSKMYWWNSEDQDWVPVVS